MMLKIIDPQAKLERKEQRRLKWIQDRKRNAYLWEMNNYMSRGRLESHTDMRTFRLMLRILTCALSDLCCAYLCVILTLMPRIFCGSQTCTYLQFVFTFAITAILIPIIYTRIRSWYRDSSPHRHYPSAELLLLIDPGQSPKGSTARSWNISRRKRHSCSRACTKHTQTFLSTSPRLNLTLALKRKCFIHWCTVAVIRLNLANVMYVQVTFLLSK